jgi:hypothetical protein
VLVVAALAATSLTAAAMPAGATPSDTHQATTAAPISYWIGAEPRALTATKQGRSVRLSWQAGRSVTAYYVYRAKAGHFTRVATLPGTRHAWRDRAVTVEHTYRYTVKAVTTYKDAATGKRTRVASKPAPWVTARVARHGDTVQNAKAPTVASAHLTLLTGQTVQLGAQVTAAVGGAGHKPLSAQVRYRDESDCLLATLGADGSLTAGKPGTETVWAFAHDGAGRFITVTIEPARPDEVFTMECRLPE